jgi:hypothetical protein
MADREKAKRNLSELLDFIENAPVNDEIIAMDCNDHCEQLASLAERVANGAELLDVLPELQHHIQYWGDCREEFIALVNILRAEMSDMLPELQEWADE